MMEVESATDFDADGRMPVFDAPYTVVLGLDAEASVPKHSHPGHFILFIVLDGTLDLSVGEETETLEAGDFARFDGDQDIAVEAIEDVRALVVFTGS